MRFFITQHCQERYLERVRNNKNTSPNLMKEILRDVYESKDITNEVYDNIPRYILFLYEKYKTANIKIFKSKDKVIYIAQKRKGTESLYNVITCYFDNNHWKQFENTVLNREEIFLKIKQIKKQLK
jgi:hypothetical protein